MSVRTTARSVAAAVMITTGLLPISAAAWAEEAPAPTTAAAASGECTSSDGVTIVVDFQELGGGVHVGCAPNGPASGFEALRQAGFAYDTTVRFPGFLCRIDGKPANDPCQTASPAHAYWSYWLAPRGGPWCYSNFGAGNRKPVPGTVEGWSFSKDRTASQTPPPRNLPGPLGSGPRPGIPARDCTTPTEGAIETTTTTRPTTTTPPPTTRPPSTPAPGGGSPSGPGSTPDRGSGGGSDAGGSTDSREPGRGGDRDGADRGGASNGEKADPTSSDDEEDGGKKDVEAKDEEKSEKGNDDEAAGGTDDGDTTAADDSTTEVAITPRDAAGGDGSGSGGSPVPVILTLLGLAVVGGLVALAARRRTTGSGTPPAGP